MKARARERSYPLASRESRPRSTVVDVSGVPIGAGRAVVIAGPCSVESRAMLLETAGFVAGHGADLLRGGAFKPRSSPYSFQGFGEAGPQRPVDAPRGDPPPLGSGGLPAGGRGL